MDFRLSRPSIAGTKRRKVGDFVIDLDPEDSNVNQFISHVTKDYMDLTKDQWASLMNNRFPTLIPNSHPNNQFASMIPNSYPNNQFTPMIQPPKESTNHVIYGSQNTNQQAQRNVNHNPILSNEFISSINTCYNNGYNSTSINIPNSQYFGGSLIDGTPVSISHPSAENCYQQQSFHQGQDRSFIFPTSVNKAQCFDSSWCNLYDTEATHIMPNNYNHKRSNFGTLLQPHVQMSTANIPDNHQPHQLPLQLDNQFNDHSNFSQYCYDINCNLCGSIDDFLESRKSKCESWTPNGTLMDVVASYLPPVGNRRRQQDLPAQQPTQLPTQLPPLEQWSSNSVRSEPVTMASDHPEVNSGITQDLMGNNQIFNNEPEFCVKEKTSPRVNCELNQVSDDYELVLQSMKTVTSIDLTDCDENEPVSDFGPGWNIKKTSPEVKCGLNEVSDDYESVSQSMKTVTSVNLIDCDENGPVSDFGPGWNIKKTSPEVNLDDYGSEFGPAIIKKTSASFADSFNAFQITEHLSSFIQHKEVLPLSVDQSPCQFCHMDKLSLTPAPVYCSSCDSRIKQNVGYYRSSNEGNKNTNYCFCNSCFKTICGDTITIFGVSISKANLKKAKNDEEKEDSWVECDKCKLWQHRICGLYNNERDSEGIEEYICPKCRLIEIENENENENKVPLLKTFLGAKDLPRTNLSDHIEQRLFKRMKQEREETAKSQGIEIEKVAEAEGLVVRVVVSVDKHLEVKQEFRDIFNGESYPETLAYRSKLILLFQNVQGVDMCLFGMYVQEFGSECDGPNNRCVYISYLDSVKYFQPERQTASGESLRTFVYHEILIGYLEHCKKRGFATCYIWAYPPKGSDNYIFYCHPVTQKKPNQDKLRQWYKSMLKKAMDDGIVVDHTNIYNHFFVSKNKEKAKMTSARLPYFDGDGWSGPAVSISKKLDAEEKSGGLCCKLPTKRAMGQDKPTKDVLVMKRLGKKLVATKENFMVVQLHHRNRTHTCHPGKNTPFSEVLSDTKDNDGVIVNNFLETRVEFLNKCQKSLYQFDTLNNAKYSSMMIMYHITKNLLINPISANKLTNSSMEVTTEPKTEQPQKQNMLKGHEEAKSNSRCNKKRLLRQHSTPQKAAKRTKYCR